MENQRRVHISRTKWRWCERVHFQNTKHRWCRYIKRSKDMNKIIFSLLDKKKKFQLKIMFFLIAVYFFFEFASLASIPIFVGILASPDLVINKVQNFLNLSLLDKYSNTQFQILAAFLVILIFLINDLSMFSIASTSNCAFISLLTKKAKSLSDFW